MIARGHADALKLFVVKILYGNMWRSRPRHSNKYLINKMGDSMQRFNSINQYHASARSNTVRI